MQVFTRDGKLINQFGEKRRIPVQIADVPEPLLNAFLATERTIASMTILASTPLALCVLSSFWLAQARKSKAPVPLRCSWQGTFS